MPRRAIVIVLDGCGAGAAPDAADFGDSPANATLKNIHALHPLDSCPNLADCGFLSSTGLAPAKNAAYGRLQPMGQGKDSVTGHWEMMGARVTKAFPTFPHGFSKDTVAAFVHGIGRSILGNRAASGTEIIAELGEEHQETGRPIVYTSADSVFQIAAHEGTVPVETLYEWCQVARGITDVQRVIARPFTGEPGAYHRTERRRDFPIAPPENVVDEINEKFGPVLGIGVVPELFDQRGFMEVKRTQSNPQHFKALQMAVLETAPFIFANFEDFDMKFGHRNDPRGFAQCLVEFDEMLGQIQSWLGEDDLLILTADHGNDPTDESTDHTREFVPFVMINSAVPPGDRGDIEGFEIVGQTVLRWLEGGDLP
ncbi:MAG: phosphopentomutase [Fimbriimonadaceae bacterium]|nr:phosphopentomutase [Fimbriimonadaceae bacterium]